ncbi:response regulator [Pleurocapsales cyanobacterium LEGE 10410]|nr:response regulator [Pleurocapsales cyanobacterium LEGE 10410]
MSLNPDIRDQAYQFFIEEAQELLQVLETGLLDLRQDHSTPKVHELMRAAHSIKGGAASVELGAIELLAHRLEDFFKALYSDEVEFDAELEGLLLQGYDCLSTPLTEQIEQGTFDEEAALLAAEPVFAALEIRLEDALKNSDNYIPSANDLGVDIVASIFEVDVAQALEHLQQVASNPANYDPTAELQGQLEMFAGFAELFNLPGFSDIVHTAQTALTQNPHCVLEIIKATIADCTIAKERVLEGDRDRGGEASPTLQELALATEEAVLSNEANLWASAPAAEPLAEDIFGTIPNENPELSTAEVEGETSLEPAVFDEAIAEETNLWSSAPADPLAEDIFGTIPDENLEPSTAEVEGETSLEPMVFDEAIAEEANLWASAPAEPLAEDIFGTIPDENLEPSEAETSKVTAFEPTDADNLDIEQIFGVVPDEQTAVGEIDAATKITVSDNEIERIFGVIPDEQTSVVEDPDSSLTVAPNEPVPTENLEEAVESIESIFESLPSLDEATSFSLPTEKTANKPSPPVSKSDKKAKATPKLSVRVDLDRLERMNNLLGELTINRNSLALQNEQLQESVSEIGQKFSRFREVTKKLREISDQMLLEQRSHNLHLLASKELRVSADQPASLHNSTEESAEFDSLEMDSYNLLYSSLQEVLEEIVQLEEGVDDITIFAKQSDRTINSQRQMLGQMRDELMWVRMLPLDGVLQRFPRTLRDLSRKYHKPVELKLKGTGVLVDKAVLEKLSDPLLHLLRNGFDHGIEEPEIRTQQGKPATGLIEIHAYYQGNQTVIEVKDDGKGLDLDKITKKGLEKGLISPQEAASAPQERLFDLIFEPGFSTASKVSEISGRGVGMNIVRSQIEALKGKIGVTSAPGEGSTFTLRLPLTLTIAKLLVCSLGSTTFAIPSDSIEEIIIPTQEQVKFANNQKFLSLNTKLIPICPLKEVLQYNCPVLDTDSTSKAFKTIASPEDWFAPLLLLRRGQQLFALEVVSLLSEQELVIKPYGKAIAAPAYTYGCTILGDGSLIPAVDGSALISQIFGEEIQPSSSNSIAELAAVIEEVDLAEEAITDEKLVGEVSTDNKITGLKTIMVVDDSTALRRTMALTLEKQGYQVIQKKDGKEALHGFKQNPHLDLIICDIEMPVMNGFEFLSMRRRDSALSQVPTFMLTSRSGAKHRNLAKQLGANGYFTKPYVEPEFVREIKKILEDHDRSDERTIDRAIALKTKTILVIDDSSALRRTLALSLETRGYRVLQGRDGQEGLQQLRDNLQTDLVVCDVEMPNMNGFEFLTARRQEGLTNIPVVMLTSRSTEKHRALATSLGAEEFFTKPYVEDKFLQDIEQLIKQHE